MPPRYSFAGALLAQPLAGGALYGCGVCAFKFRHPILTDQDYAKLYDNAVVSAWSHDERRLDWSMVSAFLTQNCPERARVLDVGCNTGGLLARLAPGFDRYGLEVNQHAAESARRRSGAVVWTSIADIPEALRFDAILLVDVIEHVAEPARFLEMLLSRLAPRGQLVVTTGDAHADLWERSGANWWYCAYPEHISFLSERWLAHPQHASRWIMTNCQRFNYDAPSPLKRTADMLLTWLYRRLPGLYLRTAARVMRCLGHRGDVPIRGMGLSADHLLFALTPAQRD